MRAYREMLTVEDPQQIVLKPQMPLHKGQQIELLIMVEEDEDRRARARERQLLRENGRLVVAAFPGEPPIDDAQARRVLKEIQW